MASHLVEHVQNPENLKRFQQEKLLLDVASLIYQTMERKRISRRELADKLEVTKGRITQYLGGEKNLTLRTLADVFTALDSTLVVEAKNLAFNEPRVSCNRQENAITASSVHIASSHAPIGTVELTACAIVVCLRIEETPSMTGFEFLSLNTPRRSTPVYRISSDPLEQGRITADG
jgi:transcriptional regulator with XRE-family HTH domain